MIYATQDDLTRRFSVWELAQLTDAVNRPPSVINADRVALALADASTLIDGYLGVLYRLPLRGCRRVRRRPLRCRRGCAGNRCSWESILVLGRVREHLHTRRAASH